jgi:(p)ppGpp synthase/HD superfamily hydrolase
MYSHIAFKLAEQAHKGQKDKAGNDYIHHPIYVAEQMETDVEKAVAYLHDVVEDTHITLSDLQDMGFPKEIVDAVDAVTKRSGEAYDDYIKRVVQNPIAKKVKIADMKHNSDISRFKSPTEEDRKRCNRYKTKIHEISIN